MRNHVPNSRNGHDVFWKSPCLRVIFSSGLKWKNSVLPFCGNVVLFKCDYRCIMRFMRKETLEDINIFISIIDEERYRSSRQANSVMILHDELCDDFGFVTYVAGRKVSIWRTELNYICLLL